MADRLVTQLVDAGLLTEAQAGIVGGDDPSLSSSQIVQNLVAAGLDERALAGFFVGLGFGPMLRSQELARADADLVSRLSAIDAHELCAMPLKPSPAGAIVAMADPTDERAIAKLTDVLGGEILPTVAKLSDLLSSIHHVYPSERPTLMTDPVAAARSRPPSGVVPLVQEKPEIATQQTLSPFDPALSRLASTASPVWDRAWSRSATEREVSVTPRSSQIPVPVVSRPPAASTVSERPATLQPPTVSDSAIDAHLSELKQLTSRDDVVRVACHACLTTSRGAAFLALRKGVFRGWDGAGEDVTSAGIRSLWVPASNPSILNEVLHSGRMFHGAYGQTAADHLFRAAFGSQGREVVIVPVMIGSRMVGVLCASDPANDTAVIERVAEAVGQAFERLIVSHKSGA